MTVAPVSPLLGADDNLEPFERRTPESEVALEKLSGIDSYSPEQAQQISRILPIKICTYPEYWLDETVKNYIPQDYKEHPESYDVRKTRALSCFESYYSHLVDLIVGTALRKGVTLPQTIPDNWKTFFDNVDLEGHSLTSYTKDVFTEALNGGVAGIWAEYPRMPEGISSAEERKINARPYFVTMKVDEVLDCRSAPGSVTINGVTYYDTLVTYLRVKSEIRRPSANEHFEEVVPTVVVYDIVDDYIPVNGKMPERRARCRVYEKDITDPKGDAYILPDNGTTYLSLPFIPFSPTYGGKKEAYFRARPLLYDVARLNLHHWATCADLSEIIHLHASPILTGTGIRADDNIFSGAGRALMSQNPDARFGILSAAMDGAETTLKELARIEVAMDKLAAVTMTPGKTQVESGFAKLLDRSQSDSQLAVLVGSLQDSLNRALLYASAYRNYEKVEVSISKNFIPAKLHSQQVMAYSALFKDCNALTLRLFLEMLEAGELFEGLHGFSIDTLLKKMGLTGDETAKDLGIGAAAKIQADPPGTNNIKNTVTESGTKAKIKETQEVTVQTPPA